MNKIIRKAMVSVLVVLTISSYAQKPKSKYYLSISHEIADYSSWRTVFDELNTDRTKAGIKDIFVKKDINNTNSVTIFSAVKNLDKAKAFMSSTGLKEAMKRGGVASAPEITYYTAAGEYDPINTSALVTTITHSVANFSAWKTGYESAGPLRESAGLEDHLLLRSLSDENVVTVLGTSSSAANFQKFMSNPDLKGVMEKAGVTSKPEVEVLL